VSRRTSAASASCEAASARAASMARRWPPNKSGVKENSPAAEALVSRSLPPGCVRASIDASPSRRGKSPARAAVICALAASSLASAAAMSRFCASPVSMSVARTGSSKRQVGRGDAWLWAQLWTPLWTCGAGAQDASKERGG